MVGGEYDDQVLDNQRHDQVLILLGELADSNKALSLENRALRDELLKRDEANRKSIDQLSKKLDATSKQCSKVPRRTRGAPASSIIVPAPCRVSIQYIFYTRQGFRTEGDLSLQLAD